MTLVNYASNRSPFVSDFTYGHSEQYLKLILYLGLDLYLASTVGNIFTHRSGEGVQRERGALMWKFSPRDDSES